MVYKVIANGEKILVTRSYKNAANTYDEEIRKSTGNLIIRLYVKKDGSDEWELARKDWL